jgi:bifunctional DNA-binding transcriptional regulator/antitoxin component of YhaV-PrlF toxin-antitoxin module
VKEMKREKKMYISKVDENGRVILPDELRKNIHSGLVDIEVREGKLLMKESEPDYILTWTPDRK